MALEKVRDAGLLERFHATRTQLGFDSCVVVAAQYTGPSKLDASVLLPALRTVIHKHASLCVQIAEDEPGKDMRFVRLPKIDLQKVVTFLDDSADDGSAIEERIAAIMKVPVEVGTAKPLWRVEVLAGRTVLFAYNHSIGDGQSGLAFHATLQAALGAPAASDSASSSDTVVEIPADINLAPPLEALTDVSVSLRGYASVFFDTFAPKRFTNGYTAWTGNAVVPAASLNTHVRCWTLPPAEGAALLAQCRQHKTTLTAVFHTLSVEVLSRLVADEQAKKGTAYKTLSTSVPVSMRRFTKTPVLAMCDQASSVHSYVPLTTPPLPQPITTESFPWKAAADFAARLQREAPSTREAIGTISLLFSLGISRDFFLGSLGGKRPDAFEVSNLGRFPSTERAPDNGWAIGKVCFAQCDPVRGAALKLNVVGAPDGSVGFSCTWGYGAVDDELADAFIAGIKEGLLALSKA